MNLNQLTALQTKHAELMAAVQDELAKHDDKQLQELLDAHLKTPAFVLALALSNPDKLCTMAAVPIAIEQMRRAEVAAMEAT